MRQPATRVRKVWKKDSCYLLAKTPASFFSFGQSFQLTRLPLQRTGGASMSSYLDLDIGQPAGPATDNGSGGKSRHYSGGDVFVAPAGRGPQTWTLLSDAWASTGVKHDAGTALVLEEADAAILLRVRPSPPPSTIEVNLADYLFNKPRFTREWLVDGVARLSLRPSADARGAAPGVHGHISNHRYVDGPGDQPG